MINQTSQRTITFPKVITYLDSSNPNTSTFHISPITKGFGCSIGHCLRRTLLLHTPGVSPIAIKIIGVAHEFDIVPGIKEDMLAIKANLRTMPITTQNEFTEPIQLKVQFPAEARQITAKDLPGPLGLIFTNPDHYLFTLTGNSAIEIEIWFIYGRDSDDPATIIQKTNMIDLDLETLLIETSFKPVSKVAVQVSPIIKGGKSFESLDITISTDSSLSPLEAFNCATHSFFTELGESICEAQCTHSELGAEAQVVSGVDMQQPIAISLAVHPRIISCLENIGIKTIQDLVDAPKTMIEDVPMLTEAVIDSINSALEIIDKNLHMKNT